MVVYLPRSAQSIFIKHSLRTLFYENMKGLTFVTRFIGLKSASLEAQISEEYFRLSRCLEKFTIVTEEGKPTKNINIYRIHPVRLPKFYGLTKILLFTLAPLRRRKEIDFVYVRTFSPPELVALWASKRLAGLRTVLLLVGTWLFEPLTIKNVVFRYILRKAISASDRLILYSPLMLKEVKRYAPDLDEEKIRYVHNAVDINRFRPNHKIEKKALLYVGRVNEKKGVKDLIYALSRLAQKFPKIKLLIIGADPTGGAYVQRLKVLAFQLGIRENVDFVGPVPNKDMPQYYNMAKVFLFASRGGEGIPRSILEAMACGVPVVATDVAGIPEAVKEDLTGFLVPPYSPTALAEKVEKILEDPSLRNRLSKSARKKIKEGFSWEKVIPSLIEVFQEVAK